jgi:hypothetical protein
VKSLLQNALLARARAKIRVEATDGSSFASVSSAGSAAERFGESVGMRGASMACSVIKIKFMCKFGSPGENIEGFVRPRS